MDLIKTLECPISLQPPVDAVMAEDGYVYERVDIQKHLATRKTSPMTNLPMGSTLLKAYHVTNLLHTLWDGGDRDERLVNWRERVDQKSRKHPAFLYRDGKITQITHADGRIDFFNSEGYTDGYKNCIRSEYREPHPFCGQIRFYEKGVQVRNEYECGHRHHGRIDYIEFGEHVRTEYGAQHYNFGRVDSFVKGAHVQSEYSGWINYYERARLVRTVFKAGHARFGQIFHYSMGSHTSTTFGPHHEMAGAICLFHEGWHVRTEFSEGHPRHGEVIVLDNPYAMVVRFAPGHPNHGEARFYSSPSNPRVGPHEHHLLEDGLHLWTEYERPHPEAGRIQFFFDDTIASVDEQRI